MEYQDCVVNVGMGKNPDGTDKTISRSYKQIVRKSVTVDDMLKQLSDEKTAQSLIADWYYGQDLRTKSEVRQAILQENENPEKSIEKLAKDLFKARAANGKPISEEQSLKMARMYIEMESGEGASA